MNWRTIFINKLDELTPFEILTYNSLMNIGNKRLFNDRKILSYLEGRLKELDPVIKYSLANYNDFYSVVMCLLSDKRHIYAVQTNKNCYLTHTIHNLNKEEKLELLAYAYFHNNNEAKTIIVNSLLVEL